jgi:hypothetical protein
LVDLSSFSILLKIPKLLGLGFRCFILNPYSISHWLRFCSIILFNITSMKFYLKLDMRIQNIIPIIFLLLVATQSNAQQIPRFGYPTVDESRVINTRWKYTYTTHLESNTTIHQADKGYLYYINFKYDYTFEQLINGKLSKGNWSLGGSTLFYPFRSISKFEIAELNSNTLILEFTQPNSTGTYQYHFVAVSAKESPFARPEGELPEVIVEAHPKEKQKRSWLSWLSRGGKNAKKEEKEPTYISIELVGGGYYGGIDPVVKDFIEIKSDGRLIQEFQSVNQPLRVNKKYIPRLELEQLAEYITKAKFFDMPRLYDCGSTLCERRKMLKPSPIPLRLMVTYGDKRKVVTIAIWGMDNSHTKYVDYPPELDKIIDAIQRLAHRIEDTGVAAKKVKK